MGLQSHPAFVMIMASSSIINFHGNQLLCSLLPKLGWTSSMGLKSHPAFVMIMASSSIFNFHGNQRLCSLLPKSSNQTCIPHFQCQYSLAKQSRARFFTFSLTLQCLRTICHVATPRRDADTAVEERQHREIPPNVWDDHFIQSRRSAFLLPVYREEAQDLVKAVKEYLATAFQECPSNWDVLTRLTVVDSLVNLGVDRYFTQEITDALDFVSRCWKQMRGCLGTGSTSEKPDLSTTALGFRLLRLNRYHGISSDCFVRFETSDGEFLDSNRDGLQIVKMYLNLLRASSIQFPGEVVLQRAETFATDFLKAWLYKASSSMQANPDILANKVRYALKYPWHINPPRWEARNSIDFYQANQAWLMEQPMHRKILQLAKLDFNILQANHQEELKLLSRWWNASKVSKWSFFRHRPVESYFGGAVGIFEPEFCDVRVAITKAAQMLFLLDDIYDTYATPPEIPMLNHIMERFGLSTTPLLHGPIRELMQFVIDTVSELGQDCSEKQHCNIEMYVRQRLQELSKCYQLEKAWNSKGCVPSLEEYLKNGGQSVGVWPIFVIGKLQMCDFYPVGLLEQRGSGVSDFEQLCGKFCRLTDDIHDFEDEKKHGDMVSAVECYMQDNKCGTEDALKQLKLMAREFMREITMQYLSPVQSLVDKNNDDSNCRRLVLEVTRGFNFFYYDTDGFTFSNEHVMNQIRSVLFEEVPMSSSQLPLTSEHKY